MRAALLVSQNEPLAVVDNVEIDPPGPGGFTVPIAYAGLCHSDVHYVDGSLPAKTPLLLGHEEVGVVEAILGTDSVTAQPA